MFHLISLNIALSTKAYALTLCLKYTLSQKIWYTQKEMSYNHETSHAYIVWGDKEIIKISEQKIILLSSYGIKMVKNQWVIKPYLTAIQAARFRVNKVIYHSCGRLCLSFYNSVATLPAFRKGGGIFFIHKYLSMWILIRNYLPIRNLVCTLAYTNCASNFYSI